MHRLLFGRIVFGMQHARPCAHALDFAGADDPDIAHIVFVFEGPIDDVGDDLHLAMPVHGKAACGRHNIIVEYAKGAKIHVGWVVIMVEREMPVGGKPICFKAIALVRTDRLDHDGSSGQHLNCGTLCLLSCSDAMFRCSCS